MKLLSYALTIWYTFVKMCHLPHKKLLDPYSGHGLQSRDLIQKNFWRGNQ